MTGLRKTPRVVLVTVNYPYTFNGGEVMFVAPEMAQLAEVLEKVCVVPQHAQGVQLELPEGVELDLGLARALHGSRWTRYLHAWAWPGFGAELWRAIRRGGAIGVARVWRWAAMAQVTYRWAKTAYALDEPVLFYTYWRGGATLALARLASERAATMVMTRVHRYELYEDAFTPPFQPWHPALYEKLNLVAAISQHGIDYLRAAGVADKRLFLSRLGTAGPSSLAAPSTDGGLRIVSCSFVTPVKRVLLIAEALMELASSAPTSTIHWTHFGDGPDLGVIRARIAEAALSNLNCEFAGHVGNRIVLAHYAQQPVDFFLSLSVSEGLPVSIQEAAAAGIPIIATDVGGVSELVSRENGVLLPANPSASEVAAAIRMLAMDSDAAARDALRGESRMRWSEGFDAKINHQRFARKIQAQIDILNSKEDIPNEV